MLLFIAPAGAAERALLVVGDSLSAAFGIDPQQGWVALLGKRLRHERTDYKVVNASISGDTTANGAARLPALLARHKPAIVIIQLGGNDGLRGLPIAEMKHNLAQMVQQAQSSGAQVVLVGVEIPPNYGPVYTDKFRATYRTVATEFNVPLVPSILRGIELDRTKMQADGLHPNAGAQQRLLENVWRALRPLL